MALGVRLVAVVVVVSFLGAGPVTSIARAQQPTPAPSTPSTTPTPSVVPQPDLFEEALKKGQPVTPSGPTSFQSTPTEQPMPPVERRGLPYGFYQAMAGFATFFLIPGKIATCAVGTAVSGVLLGASLGSGYSTATEVAEEGCGGKWILTADDLLPGVRPPGAMPTDQP